MPFHLHVFNLRSGASNQDLRRLFSDMTVEEDGVTIIGGPEGEAIVTFANQTDLLRAMKRNGEQHLKFKVATDLDKLEAINRMCIAKLQNISEADTSIQSHHSPSVFGAEEIQSSSRDDIVYTKDDRGDKHVERNYDQAYGREHERFVQQQRKPAVHGEHTHSVPDYYNHILSTVQAVTDQGYSKFDQIDHSLPMESSTYRPAVKKRREHSPKREHEHSQQASVENVPRPCAYTRRGDNLNYLEKSSQSSVEVDADYRKISSSQGSLEPQDVDLRRVSRDSGLTRLLRQGTKGSGEIDPYSIHSAVGHMSRRDVFPIQADSRVDGRSSDQLDKKFLKGSTGRDQSREQQDRSASIGHDVYNRPNVFSRQSMLDSQDDSHSTYSHQHSVIGKESSAGKDISTKKRYEIYKSDNTEVSRQRSLSPHDIDLRAKRKRVQAVSSPDRHDDPHAGRYTDSSHGYGQAGARSGGATPMWRDTRVHLPADASGSAHHYPEVTDRKILVQKQLQASLNQAKRSEPVFVNPKRSHALPSGNDSKSGNISDSEHHAKKRRTEENVQYQMQKDKRYSEKKDGSHGRTHRSKEHRDARSEYKDKNSKEHSTRDASQKPKGSNSSQSHQKRSQPQKSKPLRKIDGSIHHSVSIDLSDIESDTSSHSHQLNPHQRETRSDAHKSRTKNTTYTKGSDSRRERDKSNCKESGSLQSSEKLKPQKSEHLKEMSTDQWFLVIYQMQPTSTATDVLSWCSEGLRAYKMNFFAECGPKRSAAMALVLFDNKTAARNAEPAITEKGYLTHRYELYTGYRFIAQLGDTCTVTEADDRGDRFVSLKDRSRPPFVLPEFTITETANTVYLCVTGFDKTFYLTASHVLSWFQGAKGVAITCKLSGHTNTAFVAFDSDDDLNQGIASAKITWKSHKHFTAKEALTFLGTSPGCYIRISTARREDRGLLYEEKKILSHVKKEQAVSEASSVHATVKHIHPKPQAHATPKQAQVSTETSNALPDKADATVERANSVSEKSHTSSTSTLSISDKPKSADKPKSTGKSNYNISKEERSKAGESVLDTSKEEISEESSKLGKHHDRSDEGNVTLDSSPTPNKVHSDSEKSYASSTSDKTTHKTHTTPEKVPSTCSKNESFIKHLKTPDGSDNEDKLILALFKRKRTTTASQILSAFPGGVCALKVNFNMSGPLPLGPRESEAIAYILFKNKTTCPSPSSFSKMKNDVLFCSKQKVEEYLSRICQCCTISESTASEVDRVLTMDELCITAINPPFTILHDPPKMHYIRLVGVAANKTATEIWHWFGGRRGLAKGVLLSVRKQMKVTCEAYIAFQSWKECSDELSSKHKLARTHIVTMMSENMLLQHLRKNPEACVITVSTESGQDRRLDPDEEELLGIKRLGIKKAVPKKANAEQFSQALPDFKPGFFIVLTKVAPKMTACEVLSVYATESVQGKSATLVRDLKARSVMAFVQFENEQQRNSAMAKRPYSERCTARARAVHLTKLRENHQIFESTESGKDQEISPGKTCANAENRKPRKSTEDSAQSAMKLVHSKTSSCTRGKSHAKETLKNVKEATLTSQQVSAQSEKLMVQGIKETIAEQPTEPDKLVRLLGDEDSTHYRLVNLASDVTASRLLREFNCASEHCTSVVLIKDAEQIPLFAYAAFRDPPSVPFDHLEADSYSPSSLHDRNRELAFLDSSAIILEASASGDDIVVSSELKLLFVMRIQEKEDVNSPSKIDPTLLEKVAVAEQGKVQPTNLAGTEQKSDPSDQDLRTADVSVVCKNSGTPMSDENNIASSASKKDGESNLDEIHKKPSLDDMKPMDSHDQRETSCASMPSTCQIEHLVLAESNESKLKEKAMDVGICDTSEHFGLSSSELIVKQNDHEQRLTEKSQFAEQHDADQIVTTAEHNPVEKDYDNRILTEEDCKQVEREANSPIMPEQGGSEAVAIYIGSEAMEENCNREVRDCDPVAEVVPEDSNPLAAVVSELMVAVGSGSMIAEESASVVVQGNNSVAAEEMESEAAGSSDPVAAEKGVVLAAGANDTVAIKGCELVAAEECDLVDAKEHDPVVAGESEPVAPEERDPVAREESELVAGNKSEAMAADESEAMAADEKVMPMYKCEAMATDESEGISADGNVATAADDIEATAADHCEATAADHCEATAADDSEATAADDSEATAADDSEATAADDSEAMAVKDSETKVANDSETITADDSETAVDDGETIAADNGETIAADDGETIAADDGETIAADDGETIAADDGETIAADDSETIAANDSEAIVGTDSEAMVPDESEAVDPDEDMVVAADESEAMFVDKNHIVAAEEGEPMPGDEYNVVVVEESVSMVAKESNPVAAEQIEAMVAEDNEPIREDMESKPMDSGKEHKPEPIVGQHARKSVEERYESNPPAVKKQKLLLKKECDNKPVVIMEGGKAIKEQGFESLALQNDMSTAGGYNNKPLAGVSDSDSKPLAGVSDSDSKPLAGVSAMASDGQPLLGVVDSEQLLGDHNSLTVVTSRRRDQNASAPMVVRKKSEPIKGMKNKQLAEQNDKPVAVTGDSPTLRRSSRVKKQ